MRIQDILANKRDGLELNDEELAFFVDAVAKNTASMEQVGAFLMATYINGMTKREKVSFTKYMMHSGFVFEWAELLPDDKHLVVDKHSTGGVGDKMSIPLAPALAACGLKVPMIAGRGLGHTGGTIDKLESIPGYKPDLDPSEIQRVVATTGCVIASQSAQMIPADKTLYAVRDVTSTVSSLPLITGSIVSKKASEGLAALILDIKVGSAAFMKTVEQAEELAHSMIETAQGLGVQTRALLSWMENPIGTMSGNALEIQESIDILNGGGPEDSIEITALLGAHLLEMTGKAASVAEGDNMIRQSWRDGTAMTAFKDMLKSHHVEPDVVEALCTNPASVLPQANLRTSLTADKSGYIQSIDGMSVALLGLKMKAGRAKVGDIIDPAVGVELLKMPGDKITAGEPWCVVHHNDPLNQDWDELGADFLSICTDKPTVPSRMIKVVY